MIRYVFREDEPLRIKAANQADPQTIGEALEEIRVSAGGELEPRRVVDAARNKKHALHRFFEWDDSVAGEAWRIEQARSLVRIVRVVDEEAEEGSTRAFISVNMPKGGVSYRTVSDVRTSRDLAEAVLAQAERDLQAFERRYQELKEVCEIVSQAKEAVRRRRKSKDNRPAA